MLLYAMLLHIPTSARNSGCELFRHRTWHVRADLYQSTEGHLIQTLFQSIHVLRLQVRGMDSNTNSLVANHSMKDVIVFAFSGIPLRDKLLCSNNIEPDLNQAPKLFAASQTHYTVIECKR